jgi:hypothetical protein
MPDTASDRLALAKLARELEGQLKNNMDTIFRPLIPLPDHVRFYFVTYAEYLKRALAFPELPQRDLFQQQLEGIQHRLKSAGYMHRDNLGDILARIGSLASALEASTIDVEKELETAQAEIGNLRATVQRLTAENEQLKKERGKPPVIGG